jgi:amino acid transporter
MAENSLKRDLSLTQAVAVNMIDMVGIGPFIVLPIVLQLMGGPQHITAWVAGAVLALIDGFIWAELGAAMPHAGGSYVFLKEAYGKRWGKLMSFLFIWQTMIQAPLVVASGAIGFAQYFSYLVPLDEISRRVVSGMVVVLLTVLLYRKISAVGKISVLLWAGVLLTLAWFIIGGLSHFDPKLAFDYPDHAWDFSWAFWMLLGQATVKTMYSYLGYYNVCHLGGEISHPEKIIPKAIFISIIGIAVIYLLMQYAVIGVIPWREAQHSQFIVSTLIERLYGATAGKIATVMVLWVAFSSLFAVMLGYSSVPYAAAIDGNFFAALGKLHPTKNFPYLSLLWLGALGFLFSMLFRLSDVIDAILAMRVLVQFIGGAVGVMILRKTIGSGNIPFKMWLFPLPAVVAIILWFAILLSTGISFALSGIGMSLLGGIVFLVRAGMKKEWPFNRDGRSS